MADEILINVTPHEVRVALLEKGSLLEIHIERQLQQGLLGNIYQGKVNRLLPGIQAAFVDIGHDRSAFLHLSDILVSENKTDIREVLKPGQELLVQVYKDPLGTKGARLSTQFTIPGRYLVLTPGVSQVTVSQKITDEAERLRLLTMAIPGDTGGYIFRTAAVGANQTEIDSDKVFLNQLWLDILDKAKRVKPGERVYEELPIIQRVLRDLADTDVEKIWVDDIGAFKKMREFASRYITNLHDRILLYTEAQPLFDTHLIDSQLQKALQRKVYLKSGGHLIFDQTEAMTTIDVNTGSYLGRNNLEETIFKTNIEAIEVIAHQVRLRNIGGIIIIDFIDMADKKHQSELLAHLRSAMAKDSVKVEISELSRLSLVQMTRKRTRDSLEHLLCVPCPLCQRRGSIKSLPTICYEIFRELQRVATDNHSWKGLLIVAANDVINMLMNKEASLLAELERQLQRPIKLKKEIAYTQEYFSILPLPVQE